MAQKTAELAKPATQPELRLTTVGVRTADASGKPVVSDAKDEPNPDAVISVTEKLSTQNERVQVATPSPRPAGQLAVFVSRKDRPHLCAPRL